MTDQDDDIKEGEEVEGEHDEIAEPNLAEVADLEVEDVHFPIGAPVSILDDDLGEVEDMHEAVFRVKPEDTHHLDPYGIGAPEGLEGEEGASFEEEEEEAFADIPEY